MAVALAVACAVFMVLLLGWVCGFTATAPCRAAGLAHEKNFPKRRLQHTTNHGVAQVKKISLSG